MKSIFKMRSNSERLLDENPWLWAVNPAWSPFHHVRVWQLHTCFELSQKCPEGVRWWIYITKSGAWREVYSVACDPRINVATAVCRAITCGDHITHLVSQAGDNPFLLYRAPRGMDMHAACQLFYDPSPLPLDQPIPKVMPPVEISRKQHLEWIAHHWPDKSKVISTLTMNADILSRDWPPYPVSAVRNLWVEFGRKIEQAHEPTECVEALFHVLEYLACPEPGWDGIDLKIVD